jgi:hypothetical protein
MILSRAFEMPSSTVTMETTLVTISESGELSEGSMKTRYWRDVFGVVLASVAQHQIAADRYL